MESGSRIKEVSGISVVRGTDSRFRVRDRSGQEAMGFIQEGTCFHESRGCSLGSWKVCVCELTKDMAGFPGSSEHHRDASPYI